MACQKSDCLIVARKPVKAGGAKGEASNRSRRGNSDGTGGRKTMEQEAKGNKVPVRAFSNSAGVDALCQRAKPDGGTPKAEQKESNGHRRRR